MKIGKFLARFLCLCIMFNAIPAFSEGELIDASETLENGVIEDMETEASDISTEAEQAPEETAVQAVEAVEELPDAIIPIDEEFEISSIEEQPEDYGVSDIEDNRETVENAVPADNTDTESETIETPDPETAENEAVGAYMKLSGGTHCLYADNADNSAYCGRIGEGVVYAEYEANGKTFISSCVNGAVKSYWVDSTSLIEMTDEETKSYLEDCGNDGSVIRNNDVTLLPVTYYEPVLTTKLDSTSVGIGETTTLHVDVSGAEDPSKLTFDFDKEYLASAASEDESSAIRLKGLQASESVQIVISCGSLATTAELKITEAPTSCTITAENTDILAGETVKTTVNVTGGTNTAITYSSGNEAVATVDSEGVIKGVGSGETEICAATYKSGVSGSVKVHVYTVPKTVTTDKTEYVLTNGSTASVSVTALNSDGSTCEKLNSASGFESSDTNIFKVDENGVITTVSAGTAELTAKVNGITAKATVQVVDIIVNQKTVTLGVGNQIDLFEYGYLSYSDENSKIENVTFKSSNTAKVTVTKHGVVKGLKKGSATITFDIGNGTTGKITVKVVAYPTSMKLSAESLKIGCGATSQLKAVFNKNASTQCTFTSSNTKVATVDNTGKITAVKKGTAKITVTAVSGSFAKKPLVCKVTVSPAPSTISFEKDSYTICVGDSLAIPVTYASGTIADITYTSADTKLMTVTSDGVVKPLSGSAGKSVKLTAVTQTGVTCETTINISKAPTSVAFSKNTAVKIGVGDSMQLPELTIKNGKTVITSATVTYTSSKPKIVEVSADGSIKGLKTGTSTITAKSYNGKKATLKVTVCNYPTSMTLDVSKLELGVGSCYTLTAKFNKNGYTAHTFKSSKSSVVSVTEDGTLTCLKTGTATITCTAVSGSLANKPVKCTVKVLAAPTSVKLDASAYNIAAGDKRTAVVTYDSGSYAQITYKSSNTSVFTVSSSGVITAKAGAAGKSATLTVTTQNKLSAEATVTVSKAPTSVKFSSASKVVMTVGDSCYLPDLVFGGKNTGETVTVSYKSSKAKVITVKDSANGIVTAKSAGTATITVTTYNGLKKTIKVTAVKGDITAVIPNYTDYTYYYREGEALPTLVRLEPKVVVSGKTIYGGVTYTSSDIKVATVSDNGTVTPVGVGNATITMKSANGVTADCSIKVWKASRTVTFSNNTVLGVKQTDTLVPVFDDSNSSSALTFTSSNASVLTVDADGHLTAIAAGSAGITVKGSYGLKTVIAYTVLPGPDAVQLPGSCVTLQKGDSFDLNPNCVSSSETYYSDLTVTSDNTSVAKVSGNNVKAVKAGTATITVTACNGVSAKCVVTVVETDTKTDCFTAEEAVIIAGKSGSLESIITQGVSIYNYGYTLSSSNVSVISVSGKKIQAEASAGSAEITLISNDTVLDTIVIKIEQSATPVLAVDGQTVSVSEAIELRSAGNEGSTAEITVALQNGSIPVIGDTDLSVSVEPSGMASVSGKTQSGKFSGTLSAGKNGGSAYLVVTVNGISTRYPLTINASVYRALVIGEFVNSSYKALPFASANINGIASALEGKYESVNIDTNPTKKEIQTDLSTLAKTVGNEDVTFIYIVAHGYYNSSASLNTYSFGIPAGSSSSSQQYVSSAELYSAISAIPGKVVLALDTCKSGYFVDYAEDKIGSDGDIAILTNQKHDSGAWYSDSSLTMEFFTAALMYALGNDAFASSSAYLTGSADADSDGKLTLGEISDYTMEATPKMIDERYEKYRFGYFYIGALTGTSLLSQYPNSSYYNKEGRSFIPTGMRDLVIR